MTSRAVRLYGELVFGRPWLVIGITALVVAFFAWFTQYFRLDASADSLLLENDPDWEFFRQVENRYGIREFVVVAYIPEGQLFTRTELEKLDRLHNDLLAIDRVERVDSILNVPVFADTPLTGISEDYLTLLDEGVDLEAARVEMMANPIYVDALISPDGRGAGMQVNIEIDQRARELLDRRSALRQLRIDGEIDTGSLAELSEVEAAWAEYSIVVNERQHELITAVRETLDRYRDGARIHLSGAPMIADDLISFVRGDLSSFSIAVLILIVVALGLIFRKVRFIAIPLICCAAAGTIMVGTLGLMDWRVTVVSSNFVSLLLIITISLTVHLTVRYRELRATRHFSRHGKMLRHAVLSMFRPCLYTALTTMVAFGSLIVSGILPIITFGWMMMMGVATALIVAFTLFPSIMSTLPADRSRLSSDLRLNLTSALARLTDKLRGWVFVIYALILIVGVTGLTRLRVENSFIDYFRESTEINQGMSLIDEQLGGTLSFDAIVRLPEEEAAFEDEFADDFGSGDFGGESDDAYWFTAPRMAEVKAIHEYLDADPYTGKVLSLGAVVQLAEQLNDHQPVDGLLWAVMYNRIPQTLREAVLDPFVRVDDSELRFNVRVRESAPDLNRNELLQRVETGLEEEFGFEPDQVRLTGLLVMYNNVLQSLFQSQILTLGVVMFAIMLMFLVLFRSLLIAVLCIIPNAIAASLVLGIMGWLDIPLDIMTITIAAVSVGIGVDNTIHYMYRFRRVFPRFGNYRNTMYYCHDSIGRAMYFTSMTIVAGFSILVLSNFIPTGIFGLLTSLAMLVALTGSLTLLPQLLATFKPLGTETA
ncbi:MAG: RND family transporter [Gammaproteobacteria bacterium]|nr:RND family transporter [Gammaproteobacteria bacterium]MYH45641.1 RND family transporter [Gammaproteobacteria bacterium]MYL13275.1 RND family transporter [Gammaproteobacteria bacterium]